MSTQSSQRLKDERKRKGEKRRRSLRPQNYLLLFKDIKKGQKFYRNRAEHIKLTDPMTLTKAGRPRNAVNLETGRAVFLNDGARVDLSLSF